MQKTFLPPLKERYTAQKMVVGTIEADSGWKNESNYLSNSHVCGYSAPTTTRCALWNEFFSFIHGYRTPITTRVMLWHEHFVIYIATGITSKILFLLK